VRTTVGRFWGYVGVLIALLVSLAGNVESAKLHTPFFDPSRVEYAFAGLPPLVAFISIEIVNHNPWANITWGKWITRVLLFVVAPGSALVSFVHLTLVGFHSLQVTVPDDLQMWLNVATAVLTALLIDGLILGGTAALLLPVRKVTVIEHGNRGNALPSVQDVVAREVAAVKQAYAARVTALEEALAKALADRQEPRRERKERPAPSARKARPARQKWLEFKAANGREPTGKEMAALAGMESEGAARAAMGRWRKQPSMSG
jgi:hypothetical protein